MGAGFLIESGWWNVGRRKVDKIRVEKFKEGESVHDEEMREWKEDQPKPKGCEKYLTHLLSCKLSPGKHTQKNHTISLVISFK